LFSFFEILPNRSTATDRSWELFSVIAICAQIANSITHSSANRNNFEKWQQAG